MILPQDPTWSLCMHLFGCFEAYVNGAPLPRLRSRKVQSLLALLTVRAGTEIERTRVAGLLWPASPERTALATLRRDLTDLRRALGPAANCLRSPTPRTLRLDLAAAEADVLAFDAAVKRGDAASLEEAVALYRGPLLEGWTAEWVFQERLSREQAYLRALETLAERAMTCGDPAAAEGYLRRAAAADPLCETAQRALMHALAASGNFAAALLTYRELRLLLHRELNAEPDPETQALFEQIRGAARDKAARATGPAAARTTRITLQDAECIGTQNGISRDIYRMAVLPFDNDSPDRNDEYLADRITEALITDLTKVSAVRVISGASVIQYVKARKPPPEIARELGVDAVVKGWLERLDGELHANVQLIDAAHGDPLWMHRFDVTQSNLAAVQDAISYGVVSALHLPSIPHQTENPRTIPSKDLRAYEYYLHSKYYLNHENEDDNETAIRLLKRAVSRDPGFAKAYVELARAYNSQAYFFGKGEANEKAFVAMKRALDLDPSLAGAHLAQGLLLWTPANHFPHELAIQEYRRTLALHPDLDEASEAHHQLALVYLHIGLFDRALDTLQQALELNPGNNLARFRIGVTLHYQGKYQEALAVFDNTPRKVYLPNFEYRVASSLFYLGRRDEALTRVQDFLRKHPTDEGGMVTGLEAILFATAGNEHQAEDSIRRAVEIGKGFGHFHHTAHNIASAYALMSKCEQAIEWLQKAAREGLPCYPLFERDPNLDNLRSDPCFISFMAQLRKQWAHYQGL